MYYRLGGRAIYRLIIRHDPTVRCPMNLLNIRDGVVYLYIWIHSFARRVPLMNVTNGYVPRTQWTHSPRYYFSPAG